MKATWIRLLKRAKGGRVKSSDACVSRFECVYIMKSGRSCVPVHVCVVESLLHPSLHSMGSVWYSSVSPGDDELSVVGCQVLGRVPLSFPSDPLGCCSHTIVRHDLMT